jgi:uncharacterized membrane protein
MTSLFEFISDNGLNLAALAWFIVCFSGYTFYSRRAARNTHCLSSVMHMYRQEWMERMLARDVRVADTTAIANLERSVSFFASSTMLILAGLVTVMGATEKVIGLVAHIPFAAPATQAEWEIKLLLLVVLFIYAFFKFTWSLRQYGFSSVMLGGAPMPEDPVSAQERSACSRRIARMASMAANNFNSGLRTYYFSMAVLGWFINPWVFMALSTGVVFILYRREFKSNTLRELITSRAS